MSKKLAEILGWEEGATYKVGELYYSVVGVNLYYFKDFESPRIKFYQATIIDLLDLVNEAEKVEPKKYYLRHKFLGSPWGDYLNYKNTTNRLYLLDIYDTVDYKSKFTEDEIEEIEATGFDLSNFEKVEVEND